jgi:DNA mismatch repair protein MutL
VRFRRGEAVKDVIAEAVRNALAKAGIVAEQPAEVLDVRASETVPVVELEQTAMQFDTPGSEDHFRSEAVSEPVDIDLSATSEFVLKADSLESVKTVSAEFEQLARARAVGETERTISSVIPDYAELPPVNSAAKLVRPIDSEAISSSKIQPLGQLHESFIIAVDDEGLLLIDQHVAHERILFDKFRTSETERGIESQNLLLPETIDLSPAQSEAFQLIEADLESLGFGLMRLSGRTVAIKSIPTDLPASEARNLFSEILDTIEKEKRGGAKTTLRDDIAASLACKAAIKINMKLTPEKMRWLIDRLLITTSPTTCPHGRPVILRLSMKDIERGFHRT